MVRSLSFSASAVPKVLGVKANLSFSIFGRPLVAGTGVSSNRIPHQETQALVRPSNFVFQKKGLAPVMVVLMLPLVGKRC